MRLIDADAFKKDMLEYVFPISTYGLKEAADAYADAYYRIVALLESAPTIEAKPIVHAHWAKDEEFPTCSNCKAFMADKNALLTPYCPCCGAQMDEVVDEENAKTTNNTQKVSVDV